MIGRGALLALSAMLSASVCVAQDSISTVQDLPRVVELNTNAPHASVYANDVLLGRASRRYFSLPAGASTLRLVLAGRDNWSIPPVEAPLPTPLADTVVVQLDFPYHYRLESTPYGASVFLTSGDNPLGTTPLEVTVDEPLAGKLVLKLENYWPEELEPGKEIWNVHAVRMRPIGPLTQSSPNLAYREPDGRKKWIDYAALGTAAVAGVVAVHYKFKADRRYDTYRESGDPALRSDVKRYDVYSGVALGVMQAGLGLFAFRLVLR